MAKSVYDTVFWILILFYFILPFDGTRNFIRREKKKKKSTKEDKTSSQRYKNNNYVLHG